MYAEYFGAAKLPFSVSPDPELFFENDVYREAFATLRYGVLEKKGFIVITGEVGTGKTTLLRKLMRSLGPIVHSVFIFNTQVTFLELLRLTLDDLNLRCTNDNKVAMYETLNRFLLNCSKRGHIVTLLIDEAQHLSDEVLEGVRLLSNLETDRDKLLQIVLMGQPELESRLEKPGLRQLKQRIVLQCRLTPLSQEDVRQYMDYRLEAVGCRRNDLFERDAVEAVAASSRGIPRLINAICDNALRAAYADSRTKVTRPIVEEAAHDLRLGKPRRAEAEATADLRMPHKPLAAIRKVAAPEFENVFAETRRPIRPARREYSFPHRRMGIAIAAALLVAIAVFWGRHNMIHGTDVSGGGGESTASRQDFPRPAQEAFSHWVLQAENFLAANKMRVEEKFNGAADWAKSWSHRTGNGISELGNYTHDFLRRSKDDTVGAAAAALEAVRSAGSKVASLPLLTRKPEQPQPAVQSSDSRQADSGTTRLDLPPPPAGEAAATESKEAGPEPATTDPAPAIIREMPAAGTPTDAGVSSTMNTRGNERQEPASQNQDAAGAGSVKKPKAQYPGRFEVVESSFVRARPADNADVIATLEPGTRIRIENKAGKYFRVSSLDDPSIRGYVHEEDAFFQRIR